MPYKNKADAKRYLQAWQQRPEVKARRALQQRRRRQQPHVQVTQRAGDLRRRYGITLAHYSRLFEAQGRKCAICFGADFRASDWHVDHDHVTGKVRGVLCRHCNRALGAVKDSTTTLTSAIAYLRKHR